MEKVKYIVSRLALLVIASVAFSMTVYAIGIIGKSFGIDEQYMVYAIIGTIALGMVIFWLSESYELNKLSNK